MQKKWITLFGKKLFNYEILTKICIQLLQRNGTSEDVITVNTGKNDINKIGQIDNYNGQTKLTHWSTETCNE